MQVPVPKGYSASQIEGETTASKGFVIYEGDVDWSTILVGDTESTQTTASTDDTETSTENTTNANDTETSTENTTNSSDTKISANTINTDDSENEESETSTDSTESAIEKTSNMENNISTDETVTNEDDIVEANNNENMIDTISETDTTETPTQQDINIFNLQKSRNQYVWVPVDDPSRIYGVDSNGKIWGKLYDYSGSRRIPLNWTETNGIMSITNRYTGAREPDVQSSTLYDTDGYSDMHNSGLGETRYEMLSQELEQNYYEIIESIKKYGGFYIGRYETGGLNGTAVVRKMDTNISGQNWYTCYKKSLTLKGNKDNVKTSMILGCLWDETLEWLVESGATNSEGTTLTYSYINTKASMTWGSTYDVILTYIAKDAEIPIETETKSAGYAGCKIPTGSTEYTKVNNIYDMAGNVSEWAIETRASDVRTCRGGLYHGSAINFPANARYVNPYAVNYQRMSCNTLC